MRALVAVVSASLLSSCTATLLFQPQVLVSPYYTKYQLRGTTAVQSDPGGGNPPVDNPPQTMRTFGQDHHRDDYGVRADVGDGFAGLRADYFHLDQDSASPGALDGGWGALQPTDVVRMNAEMNEVRLGYLEPLWKGSTAFRDEPLTFECAAGGVLSYRDMNLRALTDDGLRHQNVKIDGNNFYPAVRARVSWRNAALDVDYAICPHLELSGDFQGVQHDFEVRASYTLPMRDITFFGGYRYSVLEADGNASGLGFDADLIIDGFQFGLTVSF
jgi:hypothetical protein